MAVNAFVFNVFASRKQFGCFPLAFSVRFGVHIIPRYINDLPLASTPQIDSEIRWLLEIPDISSLEMRYPQQLCC
ncbi:hypothetical protein FOXB_12908 [Fusarium oxysporum f. sp. conglutinans Fo5176]|uniref:Uncharacterized protein n=1 Tax=Fusarium oxysporum (strain Fo5176) TaxID=660025 RepID=F9G2J9_FUSOF|nr:hypothetical protein FOXB_12908 [Fusarium oxysporum f. sp. conglutinans Fo5176]